MYRLIVSPSVFIWTLASEGVVYDSSSCTGFNFTNIDRIADITSKLNDIDNLYSVEMDRFEFVSDSSLHEFVNKLIEYNFARIIEDDENEPLSLKPILKIQDDRDYFIWLNRQKADGEVMNNLHNIIINLGSKHGSDLLAYQTLYPIVSRSAEIRMDLIVRFIERARSSQYLSEISIIGCPLDKLTFNDLDRIKNIAPVTLYVPLEDIFHNSNDIRDLCQYGKLTVLVRLNTVPIDILYNNISTALEYSFFVETEDDLTKLEKIVLMHSDLDYNIVPVYNGMNSSFITSVLSITEDELLSNGPNKQEIFIHQSINLFNFGKLYILPDGGVRTNILDFSNKFTVSNFPKEIVFHELISGNSWLKTRDFTPCQQCIYRYLCPSPSNFETIIGQILCFKSSTFSSINNTHNQNQISNEKH